MKPESLRARILLIEDHGPTAATLQAMLQAMGFTRISHIPNLPDAISALQQEGFDLILCDFELGLVNGLMLVRLIRQPEGVGNPNVPIVMVTAHADTERVIEALSAGIDDFLVKPVQPDIMLRCLTNVLERPRSFIKTKDYAGPDRRRRNTTDHPGRRQEDRQDQPIAKNKWFVPPRS